MNAKVYTVRNDGTIRLPVGARSPAFAEPPVDVEIDRLWAGITASIVHTDGHALAAASGR